MRVLLSDGSGLTSRQVATQLSRAGHCVEVLSPDPLALTRFTRHVRRVHRVPRYGEAPLAWLDAALSVFHRGRFDVLFPTQEQVAVLSASADRLRAEGVATAVPLFESLLRVQDKVSAHATLSTLGLPQPDTSVVHPRELAAWSRFPVFVKTPIGTASGGVRRVAGRDSLAALVAAWQAEGVVGEGPVVVQAPAAGPLVMVQAVLCCGRLVAAHANVRVREGARGGASHKRSIDLPAVRGHLAVLGDHLRWHGALSLDGIMTDDGLVYIDVNPRLVEPGNAWRAGVDLVAPMLGISRGSDPDPQPPGRPGVATHQLLLAVQGAAQCDGTRRSVLSELVAACAHRGDYADSAEELTPPRHDLRTALPMIAAVLVALARPAASRRLSAGAVANYSLTGGGWDEIVDRYRERRGRDVGDVPTPSDSSRRRG
jgi:hypothetical protein